MKKIFYAIMGAAALLLLAGCEEKGEVFYQNPYRVIVDYQPQTVTINGISGNVTPDGEYNWITSNGGGSFTLRRNTTGLIRRAEFTVAGSKDKAIINQKAHGLDGKVNSTMVLKDADAKTAEMKVTVSTGNPDDYESWGYIFGSSPEMSSNKDYPQSGFSTEDKTVNLSDVDPESNYYFWSYIVSTEGDKIYSSVFGISKPIPVRAGEDLQAAINAAHEFAELRVEGGQVYEGPIFLRDNVKVSGGWNSSFDKQYLNNRTVIDGGGKKRCIISVITAEGDRPGAHPDRYDMPIKPEFILEQQVQQCDMNVIGGDDSAWAFQSNVICGRDANNFIGRTGNGAAQNKAQDACTFVPNSDFKTLFVNYDVGDFHPAGAALTAGEASSVVGDILGNYSTDLEGNPRYTGGKINVGCYQAQ